MKGLTFDEATHTYRFNGNVVPGVTSILSPLTDFSMVRPDVLDAASKFGQAVHLACELDDLGTLDESALDASLVPYLEGWRKFSKDYLVEWSSIEVQVYHANMNYAGTPDRIGLVKGDNTVVDIKSTAALYPSVGPQLSAYAHASGNKFAKRLAVQLKSNGTYVAEYYKDPTDWPVFVSLLTVRNWCARNSIAPKFNGATK